MQKWYRFLPVSPVSPISSSFKNLAWPKSATLTCMESSKKMLLGFKSWWITLGFFPWRYCIAWAISNAELTSLQLEEGEPSSLFASYLVHVAIPSVSCPITLLPPTHALGVQGTRPLDEAQMDGAALIRCWALEQKMTHRSHSKSENNQGLDTSPQHQVHAKFLCKYPQYFPVLAFLAIQSVPIICYRCKGSIKKIVS